MLSVFLNYPIELLVENSYIIINISLQISSNIIHVTQKSSYLVRITCPEVLISDAQKGKMAWCQVWVVDWKHNSKCSKCFKTFARLRQIVRLFIIQIDFGNLKVFIRRAAHIPWNKSSTIWSRKNMLSNIIILITWCRLWISFTNQLIEIRHFSMSNFIQFIRNLISHDDSHWSVAIFKIKLRFVACESLFKSFLLLLNQHFENLCWRCKSFCFLICIGRMWHVVQIEHFQIQNYIQNIQIWLFYDSESRKNFARNKWPFLNHNCKCLPEFIAQRFPGSLIIDHWSLIVTEFRIYYAFLWFLLACTSVIMIAHLNIKEFICSHDWTICQGSWFRGRILSSAIAICANICFFNLDDFCLFLLIFRYLLYQIHFRLSVH
jgi:hypothetical protein